MAAVDSCPLDLPLAIDVEEWGNAADSPTEIVQARLQAMIDHLRSQGREVAVYTNKNGFWRFVHHKFEGTDSIGVMDLFLYVTSIAGRRLDFLAVQSSGASAWCARAGGSQHLPRRQFGLADTFRTFTIKRLLPRYK